MDLIMKGTKGNACMASWAVPLPLWHVVALDRVLLDSSGIVLMIKVFKSSSRADGCLLDFLRLKLGASFTFVRSAIAFLLSPGLPLAW
uniref:Uncharacterized protein n=1 Tax=Oryza meridionalis TaxID=40149 RepID=A0A0E0BYT1_9ORYZ